MTKSTSTSGGKIRVLGIDPGTRILGHGILDVGPGSKVALVECGAVRLPARPLSVRLEKIYQEVREIIAQHKPGVLAIEDVFHGKNFQSVLKVGEARGVVVLAAQMAGLEIQEYSPAVIKKAATGNGNADKTQVQGMMERLLGVEGFSGPVDVTDALAVAFCHGQRAWRGGGSPSSRQIVPSPRGTSGIPRGRPRRSSLPRKAGEEGAPAALEEFLKKCRARVFLGRRFRRTPGKSRGG